MIFAVISSFIFGIALGSFFNVNLIYFLVILGLSGIFFVYRFFVEGKDRQKMTLVSIFLLTLLFGVGRMMISDLYSESKLTSFVDKKIKIEGVIVAEPDIRERNTKLTIMVENISDSVTHEKILITVPLYPEFKYGDRVKGEVLLKEPEKIENEDGRTFDYGGYLRVRGIWYTTSFTTLELLSSNNGNPIKHWLFKTKRAFVNSIEKVLPEPQSSLLGGLLLGSKQSLGKEILEEFQRTGTSHIVVLSGYNIAIVADSIINFFKFLPKNISFGLGTIGIVLFTLLSGAGASGTRAAIMVLIALFVKRSNRDYRGGRILGFTIVLMLTPNPLLLIFDPSFQLSVLATIGIIFVSPILLTYLTKVPERFGLREIVSTTISTQITVLPLLIYSTGIVSLVSLPVNVLILSTIPITMFLGFLTGMFGLVSFYLSIIPAFFTYGLLWYQLKIVHLGSSLSFGVINLPAFSLFFVFITYALIFTSLYFIKKKI